MLLNSNNDTILVAVKDRLFLYSNESQEYKSTKLPERVIPANLNKIQQEILSRESGDIASICLSDNGALLAACTKNKQLFLYDRTLTIVQKCFTQRTVSKVCFTPSNDLVIADKSGDIYLYKFTEDKTSPQLLFGHLSIILDVVVSPCGNCIATCDRDEKIRVSWFPNAYNILSYCLGHEEFVTSVKFCAGIIISSSGDGTIRFWDPMNGHESYRANAMEFIEEREKNAALDRIRSDVDSENLEILTLPITHMEVSHRNGVFVAISLLHYDSVQVHHATIYDNKSVVSKFVGNVSLNRRILAFSLTDEDFYVVTDVGFHVCNLFEMGVSVEPCKYLDALFKEVKSVDAAEVADRDGIYALYKRKYNNVQEYLERKKLRLESNNK